MRRKRVRGWADGKMAKTASYEIHSYRGGNWTIVGVQEDKAEAIHQARQLLTSKTQQGVKVVEEKYDDETDRTTSAVVFTEIKGTDLFPCRAFPTPGHCPWNLIRFPVLFFIVRPSPQRP